VHGQHAAMDDACCTYLVCVREHVVGCHQLVKLICISTFVRVCSRSECSEGTLDLQQQQQWFVRVRSTDDSLHDSPGRHACARIVTTHMQDVV
jgi:hypothetical protein